MSDIYFPTLMMTEIFLVDGWISKQFMRNPLLFPKLKIIQQLHKKLLQTIPMMKIPIKNGFYPAKNENENVQVSFSLFLLSHYNIKAVDLNILIFF